MSNEKDYTNRLGALKEALEKHNVDAFLVPLADEYQGEYPPASARRMEWLTGFTGSAGMAVALRESACKEGASRCAAVFVDGRYTVQVRQQVNAADYAIEDITRDVPGGAVTAWLVDTLKAGSKVAYDPWMHTGMAVKEMHKHFAAEGLKLVAVESNLVDEVWEDRPAVPQAPVEVYDEERAGESSASKRERVGQALAEKGADAAILAAPDGVAWLLNIRGGDVPKTPLALSFAVLHADGAVDWYIDEAKISDTVREHVGNAVAIAPMSALEAGMKALKGKTVLYDVRRASAWFMQKLDAAGAKLKLGDDPCLLPKACKNDVEIEGIRQAHIRDGVALASFLKWLDEEANRREVTELEAAETLLEFRKQQEDFREPSFDTIAGAGGNGAIVHYGVTEESSRVLEKDGLFLLDSGGQYLDGTTDVTRTMVIGSPTDEQKQRFTQVLKGHIGIATLVFPAGIAGRNIDVLARQALWREGLDYAHGTGHGVGAFLGVHEGPQGIHFRSDVPLKPGMVLSNEPGFYKEDEYGIRIENLIVVHEVEGLGEGKPFYAFETVTMAPIDPRLVEVDMLTPEELDWLNTYHALVYHVLAEKLDDATREWLRVQTKPLGIKEEEKAVIAG